MPRVQCVSTHFSVPDGDFNHRPLAQRVEDNHQRLVKLPLEVETAGLRFIPRASWGGEQVHLFGFDAR
jgi:hypothetical protein